MAVAPVESKYWIADLLWENALLATVNRPKITHLNIADTRFTKNSLLSSFCSKLHTFDVWKSDFCLTKSIYLVECWRLFIETVEGDGSDSFL